MHNMFIPHMACSVSPQLLLHLYVVKQGPWFATSAKPSPTWSEDAPAENWLFITWDMMNPKARNAARFWDGGGATFAHEVGGCGSGVLGKCSSSSSKSTALAGPPCTTSTAPSDRTAAKTTIYTRMATEPEPAPGLLLFACSAAITWG
jgi:hypothetical protein